MTYGANDVGSTISKVANTALTAIAHPIGFFTNTEAAYQKTAKESTGQLVIEGVTNTLAVLGGVAVGAAAKAGTLGKSVAAVIPKLIPATTKGKIIAAVAAPVVIGAVANNPFKAAEAISKTPAALGNFGSNLAGLAANPTLANAKTLVTDNPVISTLVGAGAVAAVGGGIGLAANTIATFTNSQSTKANTAATNAGLIAENPSNSNDSGISVTDKSGEMYKIMPMPETQPTTPVTHVVKQGTTSTRRKKRTSKAVPQNISQKVSVLVNNRSSSVGIKQSKKYINREILA